jgi:hypothetical protein
MYCPNCGKSSAVEQKFCRSCGLSLEKAAQSLVEQLPVKELDKSLQEKQRKVERWLKIVGGSAISLVIISVLWGVIYKIIIVKGDVLAGLVFLGFILGLIIFALLMLYRESLLNRAANRLPSQTSPLPPSESSEKLLPDGYLEPMASITEQTTELLKVKKRDDAT